MDHDQQGLNQEPNGISNLMPNQNDTYVRCALVTPLKNELDNIQQLWNAIQSQTVLPNEWIITDNGSTDGTYEWLLEHAPHNPFPVLVLSLPGRTIAEMMNIAIRSAQHDVIACCHGGTKIPKDWLENLLHPFQEDDRVEVVAGVWEPYGETSFERWVAITLQGNMVDIDEPAENRYLPASRSLAVKRSAWEKVGGFPEWLPRFGEDTLFAIRLRSAGCKFAIARKAMVGWRPKPSLSALLRQYMLYAEANAHMGLFRGPRRFARPWFLIIAALTIGLLSKQWIAGGVMFFGLIGIDMVRLKLAGYRPTLSGYLLWKCLVPPAQQVGMMLGYLSLWRGRLDVPAKDRRAIEKFLRDK